MQRSLIWKAFSTFWSLLWQKKHAIIWYFILKWEKANAAIRYFLFFCCLCALSNASFRRNDIISRARQVVQVRYGNDSSEGAGCRNYLSHRADLSETKFNTLSSKWVDHLCFDRVFEISSFLVCCVMHKILESREVEIFKKVHKVQDQKKYFATRANIAEHWGWWWTT